MAKRNVHLSYLLLLALLLGGSVWAAGCAGGGLSGGAIWAPGGFLFSGNDVIHVRAETEQTQEAVMGRVVRTLDRSPFRIDTLMHRSGYVRTAPLPVNDTLAIRLNTIVTDSALVEIAGETTDLRTRDREWTRVAWSQRAPRGEGPWSVMSNVAQEIGTIQDYGEDPEYDTIACGGRRCSDDMICQDNVCRAEKQLRAKVSKDRSEEGSKDHLPFGGEASGEGTHRNDGPREENGKSAQRPLPAEIQPPSADEHSEAGTNLTAASQVIFEQTNQERTTRDRQPLKRDTMLSRIACRHNKDMLAHSHMGHEDSDGRQPSDRIAREHRRLIGGVGENVYAESNVDNGNSRHALRVLGNSSVQSWMMSPGHRENILSENYSYLGVCYTRSQGQGRATQLFADVVAYLDRPLPWMMSPGDSISTTVTPVEAPGKLIQYAFVPPHESAQETMDRTLDEGATQRFDGTLYLPDAPGLYVSRFIFRGKEDRLWIWTGPRVRVE